MKHAFLFRICVLSVSVSWQIASPPWTQLSLRLLRQALAAQGRYIGVHEARIKELSEPLSHLCSTIFQTATPAVQMSWIPPSTTAKPKKFDRITLCCLGFRLQCMLHFATLGSLTAQQKVAHVIGLLTERALTLATAIWENGGENVTNYELFISLYVNGSLIIHLGVKKSEIGYYLWSKAPKRAAEYTLDFHMLAAESGISTRIEFQCAHQNGVWRWWNVSGCSDLLFVCHV